MGADNWSQCPRCLLRQANAIDAMKHDAQAAYGEVSAEEYLALLEKIKAAEAAVLPSTVREDYFIGLNLADKDFDVSYAARCTIEGCGFKHEHKHTASLKV